MSELKMDILVVDDSPLVADTMAALMDVYGHNAIVAYSGPAALEALLQHPQRFAAIFSDLSMPEMDGFEFARRVNALRQGGKVQTRMLIAMSGYNEPEHRQAALESGFDRHIVKPPSDGELENLLSEIAKSR